jgi:hypothetical protein
VDTTVKQSPCDVTSQYQLISKAFTSKSLQIVRCSSSNTYLKDASLSLPVLHLKPSPSVPYGDYEISQKTFKSTDLYFISSNCNLTDWPYLLSIIKELPNWSRLICNLGMLKIISEVS